MIEHYEKYYIEVDDEDIEVGVIWHIWPDDKCYPEPNHEVHMVTNLETNQDFYPQTEIAEFDWMRAFEKADAQGRIQCGYFL